MSKPNEPHAGSTAAQEGDSTRVHANSDKRQLVKIGFFHARSDTLVGTVSVDGKTATGHEPSTVELARQWFAPGRSAAQFVLHYSKYGNGYYYSVEIDDDGKPKRRFPGPSVETDPGLPAVPTFMHRQRPTPGR